MTPLVAALLVLGGSVAIVAVASSSSEPLSRNARLGSGAIRKIHFLPQGALSLNAYGEKFADPWVSYQHGVYAQYEGREYLRALPKIGSARVAAMLTKIVANGKNTLPDAEALRDAGAQLAKLAGSQQLNTRDEINGYIVKIGSAFGPAGAAIANAYVALSKTIDITGTGSGAKAASIAESAGNLLNASTQKALAAGLPYTWHLAQYLGSSGYSDGSSDDVLFIENLSHVAYCNVERLLELDQSAQAVIGQWWGLLLTEMARSAVTPDGFFVEKVMRAMHSGAWGGMQNLASDEQVMMVAAPFASAYKIPLRDLAAKLWDECKGWSDPTYSGLLFTPIHGVTYEGGMQESLCAASQDAPLELKRTPANATQVQWHNLVVTVKRLVGAP